MTVFDSRHVDVGEGHRLYVEQCGSPGGMPVLVLHGGPGSGASAADRETFPSSCRTVIHDQRGCGRSTPLGSTTANDTARLVADIERVRVALGIESWIVAGRSWGAYLALRYGSTFRARCRGFLLFGAFLPDSAAVGRLYRRADPRNGEAWRDYIAGAGGSDDDPVAAYGRRIASGDPAEALAAARSFTAYHNARARGGAAQSSSHAANHAPEQILAFAAIQLHYARNGFFSDGHDLETLIDRLQGHPCRLVHGGRDRVTPVENSRRIARRWPGATLRLVEGAPHSAFASANFEALKAEARLLARELGP